MPLLLLSNPVGASGFGELVKARATLKSATAARSFMIRTSLAKDAQRKYHLARPQTSVKGVPGGELASVHSPSECFSFRELEAANNSLPTLSRRRGACYKEARFFGTLEECMTPPVS